MYNYKDTDNLIVRSCPFCGSDKIYFRDHKTLAEMRCDCGACLTIDTYDLPLKLSRRIRLIRAWNRRIPGADEISDMFRKEVTK